MDEKSARQFKLRRSCGSFVVATFYGLARTSRHLPVDVRLSRADASSLKKCLHVGLIPAKIMALGVARPTDETASADLTSTGRATTMKLTRSVSYAVGILLKVPDQRSRAPMTAAQISKGAKFPPRFLYRVLRKLVDANLLQGVSGPGGGYQLAKAPSRITLLEIVAAVEGDQEPTVLPHVSPRHRAAIRQINGLTNKSAAQFSRDLKRVTLSQLRKL